MQCRLAWCMSFAWPIGPSEYMDTRLVLTLLARDTRLMLTLLARDSFDLMKCHHSSKFYAHGKQRNCHHTNLTAVPSPVYACL